MNLAFLAFLVSVVVSLLSFTLIASWYVVPRLSKQPYVQALLPLAHCLMAKSYFGRRGCLMNNLTLLSFFRPVDSLNKGHELMAYVTLQNVSLQAQIPRNIRESEGPCSSAGVQGAGPLASAERAASPSAEGWREFQREGRERIAMHGSDPLSENQETPTTISARNSGAEMCPFTTSSPHWSSKVTRSRARSLPRPLWRVRTCVGR